MKEYVCSYVKPETPGQCLLILKSKPEWQKGKLNLVGGKIEPGETVQQAAKRELFEESGLNGENFVVKGCLVGDHAHDEKFDSNGWIVWFLTCNVKYTDLIDFQTDEPVDWYWADGVQEKIVHNLKLIIPLLASDAPDWKLTETDTGLLYQLACWRA